MGSKQSTIIFKPFRNFAWRVNSLLTIRMQKHFSFNNLVVVAGTAILTQSDYVCVCVCCVCVMYVISKTEVTTTKQFCWALWCRGKQKWSLCFTPLMITSIMISYMLYDANSIAPPHVFLQASWIHDKMVGGVHFDAYKNVLWDFMRLSAGRNVWGLAVNTVNAGYWG